MHQDLIEASLPEGLTGQQEAPVAPPHSQQIPHHAGVTIPLATTAAAVTAAVTAVVTAAAAPAPATASPPSMSWEHARDEGKAVCVPFAVPLASLTLSD